MDNAPMNDHFDGSWIDDDMAPAQQEVDTYFGACPVCGRHDGYLNIGRNHWFVCHAHRTKWNIGSNLFSSWEHQTSDQWHETARRLDVYRG
jgi:hypothetical protein